MGIVRGDNSLFFATGLDNSGLRSGANQATGIIEGMASSIGKINPWAVLVTTALTAFATIAAGAYNMSRDFEHAMKEVETISASTQDNFKGISQEVFNLSKISPDAPAKLANAYYQIVSAGYDGAEGLQLLETASKAAVGGVTDTITAADGLTTVLNAFGIEAENVNGVADVMFKTVQLGKTTFSELASNLSTVAPIASASGVGFEQVAGAVATLTKQGVPTAQAMTQIRSAIIGANEALGDGWSQTMTLQEAFQLLYDKADGSQTKLQEMVGRVEAVSAVLGVSGKNAKGAASDLDAMTNAAGSSEEAFRRMATSNINQWAILRNRIKATTKGIGDDVLEMSSGIAGALNDLFDDTLDDSEKLKQSFDEQRGRVFALKTELGRLNDESEERKELIEKITKAYPEYLKGVDTEKITNSELLGILDKINESYKTRYKFQKRELELQNEEQKQGDIEIQIEDVRSEFDNVLSNIQTIADGRNIKLDIDYSLSNEELFLSLTEQVNEVERSLGNATNTGLVFDTNLVKSVRSLRNLVLDEKDLNRALTEQTKIVDELRVKNEDRLKVDLKRAEGRIEAIRMINEATKLEQISQFKDSGFNDVDKAYKDRIKVLNEIQAINNITSEQYKANNNILKQYLNSENEEIRKAAEERKKLLTGTTGGGSGNDDITDLERFVDLLKQRKEEYESYENYVVQLGQESADKEYETLLKRGANYTEFLRNQLKEFEENEEKKKAIVDAASDNSVRLTPREKIGPVSTLKPSPIVLDVRVDTTSINAINRRIQKLYDDLDSARTDAERKMVNQKIEAEEEKLHAVLDASRTEQQIHRDEVANFSTLTNSKLKIEIDYWKERLDAIEEGSNAAIEAEQNIRDARAQIAQNIGDTMNDITGALREASALFQKFGDEDTAQLLDQLGGVAQGAATLAVGIATKNPLLAIQGGLQVLNSALTVEVVSDTAKFEAAIKELEKAIDKLDYVVSKSFGKEEGTSRIAVIDKEIKKQEELQNAIEAELEARKEVQLLGIRIGKKGKGSGTDPAKIEEFEEKVEEARRKVEELKNELNELLTGSTRSTLADGIIDGLSEGKLAVRDFADTFEDMMRNAMLETFKLKYLKDASEDFFKEFSRFADSNEDGISDLTAEEIATLRNRFNAIATQSMEELEALNEILEDAGIAGGVFGENNQQQKGLAGGIEKITEDQADLIAGQMNSIILDIREGLEIAQQNSVYLAQIAQNTSYNHFLESMDNRLNNIESLLS